jgi:hypothetical protein
LCFGNRGNGGLLLFAFTKIQIHSLIAKYLHQHTFYSTTKDFKSLMKKEYIGVVFRQNETGRIYGVTFIDYPNRAVLNGSRFGKEFSANIFNDLFNSPNKQIDIPKDSLTQTEQTHQHTNSDSSLSSMFGILEMNPSGNNFDEENFVREHRKKKPQKKRGRGI